LVGITLAGIFDRVGSAWREPVNAPNGGYTSVAIGGVELSALGKKVRRHRQTLRFANAVFERESEFASKGTLVTVRSARFLSADTPNLGVIRYSVTCSKAARITVRTGIDYNIWDLNGPHLVRMLAEERESVLLVQGWTSETSKRVVVAEAVDPGFGEVSHQVKGNRNLRVITLKAEAEKTYTFDKYFAVFTDNDITRAPLPEAAIGAVQKARSLGYEACLERHNAEWRKRWEESDVTIDGDDDAQLALRYSILQRKLNTGAGVVGPGLQGCDLLGHRDVHVSVLPPYPAGEGGRIDALPDQDPRRRQEEGEDRGTGLPRGVLRLGEPGHG
jgi:kojibiose phosphorylase